MDVDAPVQPNPYKPQRFSDRQRASGESCGERATVRAPVRTGAIVGSRRAVVTPPAEMARGATLQNAWPRAARTLGRSDYWIGGDATVIVTGPTVVALND